MCKTCTKASGIGISLEDMLTAAKVHGFVLLPANSPKRFAIGWDGRPVAMSDHREVAQAGVDKALAEEQVGRWELLQQVMGPWETAEAERNRVGAEFWMEQR